MGVDEFRKWSLEQGHYFDIAEENYIAATSSEMTYWDSQALAKEHEDMLHTPLPSHSPAITKDPLILMAAYEGNLDRYARLRRPKMLDREAEAVIRGVYDNTTQHALSTGPCRNSPRTS